jgi:hypothetical protein
MTAVKLIPFSGRFAGLGIFTQHITLGLSLLSNPCLAHPPARSILSGGLRPRNYLPGGREGK